MINIVLAINDQFVEQAAALIMSIYKNSKKDSLVRINIIHSTVTKEHQDIMKNMVKDMENISELNFVDMTKFVTNVFLDKFLDKSAVKHMSIETYYRLFIPTVFPQYDKVLYLDSDLIVYEDLTELYNIDINDFYAGVISEGPAFFKSSFGVDGKKIKMEDYLVEKLNIHDKTYFNSGIMLLNLDKMRKDNIQEKALSFLFKNYPLAFCDQCVLNSILNGKVKFLDRKYNVFSSYSDKNVPSILHFAGPKKPWNYFKQNEYFEKYWDYFKLTPFYNKEDHGKLYLSLKKGYINTPFFKVRLEKHHYKIRILFFHFTVNKKYLSLLCTKKSEKNY